MKGETVFVVLSFLCFFLSIYFGMLPLYVILDEQMKAQLLALSTSFFTGGLVLVASFAIIKISGKLFSQTETHP
jgi:hypothetical protein